MFKKTRNLVALLALVVVTAMVMLGCNPAPSQPTPGQTGGSGAGNATAQPSTGMKKIGFGLIWRNDQWWKDLEAAADAKAKENNFELLKADANLDAQKQVGQLESFVAQGVAGIFFAPADANASTDIVNQAHQKGIPVITLESTIDDKSGLATEIVFDLNKMGYDIGKQAADWLNKNYGGKGKWVIFTDPTNTAVYPIGDGFVQAMKDNCPNAERLTDVNAKCQRELATTEAENLFTAHNDLRIILSAQTEMGIGAAGVVDAKNMDPSTVFIGSEGNWDSEFMSYLVDKKIIKAMSVKPSVPLGEKPLELFNDNFKNGTPFPPVVKLDTVLVTQDNVSQHLDEWNRFIASEGK